MFRYIPIFSISFFLLILGCNNPTDNSKTNTKEEQKINRKAEKSLPIKITSSYITKQIEDGEPVDVQNFIELKNPYDRIEIYYWTEGVTTEIPIEVWHVWKKKEKEKYKEMVRFRIPITDYHFKEWSSIDITADDVGEWKVETVYNNKVLNTETFNVTYKGKTIRKKTNQGEEEYYPYEKQNNQQEKNMRFYSNNKLSIVDKTFTTSVINRNPVDRIHEIEFQPGKKICFWTRVRTFEPTTIYHVWYHNGKKFFKYDLEIRQLSYGWRTWSCITMGKIPTYDYTGEWKVVVEDEEGNPIAEDYLEILPRNQGE